MIPTNSKQEIRNWKMICLVLFVLLLMAMFLFICWRIHISGYDLGYEQGKNDGASIMLQDICYDGAVTYQINMTTKIVPLDEVCRG